MVGEKFRYTTAALLTSLALSACRAPRENTPGGIWHKPDTGAIASKTVDFEARAYPAGYRDPEVKFVQFTVSWEGRKGPWIIACNVPRPKVGDIYNCNWDPKGYPELVPGGKLNVSFDVEDVKGSRTEAPNGVRSISYTP